MFGLAAIGGLIGFGAKKLRPLTKEAYCLCKQGDEWGNVISCKWFKEILADFQARRNEFWNSLGQFTVILAIVTLLVILLILDKISPEAALPLISALGSFGLGKTVASVKNNTAPEYPRDEAAKKDQG